MTTSEFLESKRDVLVARWLEQIRQMPGTRGIPSDTLVDSLPDFLRVLAHLMQPGELDGIPQQVPPGTR